jgi:hypothetical protein
MEAILTADLRKDEMVPRPEPKSNPADAINAGSGSLLIAANTR